MDYYQETPPFGLETYDIEFFSQRTDRVMMTAAAHVHTAVEMLYITEGEFLVDAEGVQVPAHPGDLVLFRSNTVHCVYHLNREQGEYLVLKLTSRFLLQTFRGGDSTACVLPLLKKQASDPFLYRAADLPDAMRSLWAQMADEYLRRDTMFIPMEKAYACAMVVALYRAFFAASLPATPELPVSDKSLSLIYQSIHTINENYASDLSAADCAKAVNLSYSYYAKLFRAVVGKSFSHYLIDLRLAKAHNILLVTDLPITDVALSCGYKNPAHFTAEYKKRYGITPRQTGKDAMKPSEPP